MVQRSGGQMTSIAPVDLATAEGSEAWVEGAIEAYGRFEILYNNASALRTGPFESMPDEDWYFTIRNELHLVYHSIRAAWPHLIERGGVIINVASVSAIRGAEFVPQSAHGASKGGVLALTRHLCGAGAAHGIRVNAISPGLIRTPATAPFVDDPDGPVPDLLRQVPARRVGEPEEVAKLAAFLASEDASYINGANIVIDGGVSAMAG